MLQEGAPKLAQHVIETAGKNCHSEAVRRILRKYGFHIGLENETVLSIGFTAKPYMKIN